MSRIDSPTHKKTNVTLEGLNLIAATPPNLLWWTDSKKLPSADSDCLSLLSNTYYYSEQMDLSFDTSLTTTDPPPSRTTTSGNSRHRERRNRRHSKQQRRSTTEGAPLTSLQQIMNIVVDPEPVNRNTNTAIEQQQVGENAAGVDDARREKRMARRRPSLQTATRTITSSNNDSSTVFTSRSSFSAPEQQQGRRNAATDGQAQAKRRARRRHSLETGPRTARISNNGDSSSTVCTSRTSSSRNSTESSQKRRERIKKRNDAKFLEGVKVKTNRHDFDKRLEEVGDPKLLSTVEQALESIKCPVCFECFDPSKGRLPCALTCGHSFCMAHSSRISECPICRESINGVIKKSVALCEAAKSIATVVAATLDLAEEKAHRERVKMLKDAYGTSRSGKDLKKPVALCESAKAFTPAVATALVLAEEEAHHESESRC